MVVDFANWV
jgi:hypothetical protein